jgi:hypothetical protein
MKQLTVKEALEQGYKYWGYPDMDGQSLKNVSDFCLEDVRNGYTPVLAEKESSSPAISTKDLLELILDDIYCNSELEDMEDRVEEAVKSAVNWEEISDAINAKLLPIEYYMLTDIKLVP